jgi:hypothetical protein
MIDMRAVLRPERVRVVRQEILEAFDGCPRPKVNELFRGPRAFDPEQEFITNIGRLSREQCSVDQFHSIEIFQMTLKAFRYYALVFLGGLVTHSEDVLGIGVSAMGPYTGNNVSHLKELTDSSSPEQVVALRDYVELHYWVGTLNAEEAWNGYWRDLAMPAEVIEAWIRRWAIS